MARNLLALKIGISALAIPALGLSFLMAAHTYHWNQAEKSPENPAAKQSEPQPQMKEEQIGEMRRYTLPNGYRDVYMFTDPYDPDKHCLGTSREDSIFRCYPNAPGVTGHGGLLNMVRFNNPNIGNMRTFIDPENPALYCIGNEQNTNYMCYEKPQAPKPP